MGSESQDAKARLDRIATWCATWVNDAKRVNPEEAYGFVEKIGRLARGMPDVIPDGPASINVKANNVDAETPQVKENAENLNSGATESARIAAEANREVLDRLQDAQAGAVGRDRAKSRGSERWTPSRTGRLSEEAGTRGGAMKLHRRKLGRWRLTASRGTGKRTYHLSVRDGLMVMVGHWAFIVRKEIDYASLF